MDAPILTSSQRWASSSKKPTSRCTGCSTWLLPRSRVRTSVEALRQEANELVAIFTAAHKTAKANLEAKKRRKLKRGRRPRLRVSEQFALPPGSSPCRPDLEVASATSHFTLQTSTSYFHFELPLLRTSTSNFQLQTSSLQTSNVRLQTFIGPCHRPVRFREPSCLFESRGARERLSRRSATARRGGRGRPLRSGRRAP